MLIAAIVFAVLAALVHVYIFVLESVRWTAESTRRTFGVASLADAETLRPMAYNQGFYNLFLAIMAALGVVLALAGAGAVGVTLMLAGTACMALAALVLVTADRSKLRAGLVQGVFPLIAVVLLTAGLVSGAISV